MDSLPVIDISKTNAPEEISKACQEIGFFYIKGHGVSKALQKKLVELSQDFFALPLDRKMQIAMEHGGRAWRGYFPVGGELTSGKPDLKEGLYLGKELALDNPLVKAKTPMHGPNLFPKELPELKKVLLEYMLDMEKLGHKLMRLLSLSLGLNETYFQDHYTKDPLILFRLFNYPAPQKEVADAWGVGEHTDYGVLTILKQDEHPGLEVKSKSGWVAAPPMEDTFVCNIGDMLDRLTRGIYRSTPHRVRNTSGVSRLSFPFFFDPGFKTVVKALPHLKLETGDDKNERWDQASVHEFNGTYGEYLLGKVSRVFPELRGQVLDG